MSFEVCQLKELEVESFGGDMRSFAGKTKHCLLSNYAFGVMLRLLSLVSLPRRVLSGDTSSSQHQSQVQTPRTRTVPVTNSDSKSQKREKEVQLQAMEQLECRIPNSGSLGLLWSIEKSRDVYIEAANESFRGALPKSSLILKLLL